MSRLFNRATDPFQYDLKETGWENEGVGLESPTRAHFWEYLKVYAKSWHGKKVLDVGSGIGWLINEVNKLGAIEAVGIEPSIKNVKLSKKYYPDTRTVNCRLEDFREKGKYDVIVGVMSFGHVADLDNAFEKVSDLLTPKGELVIIVPDYIHFKRKRYDYKVEFEKINNDSYTTRVQRPYGSIAEIVRKVNQYKKPAEKYGLKMIENIPMSPTEILMKKIPRYRKMKGKTMTRLLRFVRK